MQLYKYVKSIALLSFLFSFHINGQSQAKPKSKQTQAKPKQLVTNKPQTQAPKINDGSIIVMDSTFSHWTPVADYSGINYNSMLSDSKGNIYGYSDRDQKGVYQLSNGKWQLVGDTFNDKNGKLFIDARDDVYVYADKRVYKLNGKTWQPFWHTEIPDLSFIGMDGNAYKADGGLETPIFRWKNGAWEKICNTFLTPLVDKNGRIYSKSSVEEWKKYEKGIKYWNDTAWVFLNDTYFEDFCVDRNYLYVVSDLNTLPRLRRKVIKKWDGSNWSNIYIPYDSVISIKHMVVDQFGNILLNTSHGSYFSINGSKFEHVENDYKIYNTSGNPSILNGQLYDMARTNASLLQYKPSWVVNKTTLYPLPVKAGVKPSAHLTHILTSWKMYKGQYGWGIRTLDNQVVIFPEFDSIRIEEAPEGSREEFSLFMKRIYHEVRCSVLYTDPYKLRGFKEKDMGDCYPCSGGYTGESIETIEKRGEYVKGYTETTTKLRSSGGYTQTTTNVPGYYKPSTYTTKVVGKKVKCKAPKCKEGRTVHKQVWNHKTFYTEGYE